jgi:hypothetical protein
MINKNNLKKYIVNSVIIFLTSYTITECKISIINSVKIALISTSIFVLLDMYYPNVIKN